MIAVINYEVTVVTGEVFAAGTDAKVFLQIYGEEGKTEVIQLRSRSNNFERGTTEIFKVCEHVCCAKLKMPNIWVDCFYFLSSQKLLRWCTIQGSIFFLCLIYLATELLHLLLPFNGTFKPNFEHTIKICSGCPVNDAVELLWRRWNRRLQVHLECLVLQTSFKGATKQTHTSSGTFVPTDQ